MPFSRVSRFGVVNSYLVEEDDGLTVIDTMIAGLDKGDPRRSRTARNAHRADPSHPRAPGPRLLRGFASREAAEHRADHRRPRGATAEKGQDARSRRARGRQVPRRLPGRRHGAHADDQSPATASARSRRSPLLATPPGTSPFSTPAMAPSSAGTPTPPSAGSPPRRRRTGASPSPTSPPGTGPPRSRRPEPCVPSTPSASPPATAGSPSRPPKQWTRRLGRATAVSRALPNACRRTRQLSYSWWLTSSANAGTSARRRSRISTSKCVPRSARMISIAFSVAKAGL